MFEPIFKKEWTDMVFESRNKSFGAYQLRKSYNKNMVLAFLFCMSPIASALVVNVIKKSSTLPSNPQSGKKDTLITIVKVDLEKGGRRKHKEMLSEVLKTTVPKLVKDDSVLVKKKLNRVEQTFDSSKMGDKTEDTLANGMDGEEGLGPNFSGGHGKDSIGVQITSHTFVPIEKKNSIVLLPDQKPEFEGGLKQYFVKNFVYPLEAKSNGVQGRMTIRFVVEQDGSISNVKFVGRILGSGLEEEVERLLSNMPKWKPALLKGEAVRFQFSMPFEVKISD